MSVQFQDYYKVLGVDRDASPEEITKAYRSLARKLHPDINKAPDAEDKFKELNEAHEVLKDPKTRKSYDALGANWKAGQQFTPPPNWQDMFGQFDGRGGQFSGSSSQGNFSDFFNTLFGGFGGAQGGDRKSFFSGGTSVARRGSDISAEIEVRLEDVYSMATQSVSFRVTEEQPNGQLISSNKNYQVKIPPGISDGKTIRLTGQGGSGARGGPAGDLLLKLKYKKHPKFWTTDQIVLTKLVVAPWEAALGARIEVETLGGPIALRIPEGAQSGQRLRVRERGMPTSASKRADMLVELSVGIPKTLTPREKELFERLQEESTYKPRSE